MQRTGKESAVLFRPCQQSCSSTSCQLFSGLGSACFWHLLPLRGVARRIHQLWAPACWVALAPGYLDTPSNTQFASYSVVLQHGHN